jgi:hypothetical protein
VLRSDRFSGLYVEGAASYFYDALAYSVLPSGFGSEDGGSASAAEKDEGEWFPIFRLSVGYRLTAF